MARFAILAAMAITLNPTALAEAILCDVEIDPDGPLKWFDDADVELELQFVNAAGNVVGTQALVALANRGDTHARYYQCEVDMTAATGLNLAAGFYAVRVGPSASSWTQTHPTTGVTKSRSTGNISHLVGRIFLPAAGAFTQQSWNF